MSVTENTLARLRAQESYSIVLGGAISKPPETPEYKIHYKPVEVSSSCRQANQVIIRSGTEKPKYRPRTALGKKLMALRNQAIAKGLTLLNSNEIIEEVHTRRGEVT
jgi:hypothetical protein